MKRARCLNLSAVLGVVCLLMMTESGHKLWDWLQPTARAATFTVTNTGDNAGADPAPGAGTGTLRQAIVDANAAGGSNIIAFGISSAGVQTISVLAPLPAITSPVTIDGWSQGGMSYTGPPLIELNGAGAGSLTDGLLITAGSTTVKGLVINRFRRSGIRIETNGGNVIIGNYIGTNATGTADLGNLVDGIHVLNNSTNNIIGGTVASERNIISGNDVNGVEIAGTVSTGNQVLGNFIGTDVNGTVDVGNGFRGIFVNNAPSNTIGGMAAGARNVISGNDVNGVVIGGGANASGNLVLGNYIGTDVNGTAALGNSIEGLLITGAPNNTVGGSVTGARNIISGNSGVGLHILGSASTGNQVQGNYIGVNASGAATLGNTSHGVYLDGAPNNTVGGTIAAARNIISGNGGNGVQIFNTSANVVQGNYIGTDASGALNLGNSSQGVNLNTASSNIIGGIAAGAGNLIAFNALNGVRDESGSSNPIRGNSIHDNTRLGIDLVGGTENAFGVTANDNCDSDIGPNILQNFPLISTITRSAGNITINGSLNSTASTAFSIDFYSNTTCDGSANGEGETYLGTAIASTNSSCAASFSVTLPLSGGQSITATATSPGGSTSEFSPCAMAPTAVEFARLSASGYEDGQVLLEWQTGYEVDNLGFNVYREQAGSRHLLNEQLIAGSALVAGSGVVIRAGRSYSWLDRPANSAQDLTYWLEDIDTNGRSTLHGPLAVKSIGGAPPTERSAATLSQNRESQPFISAGPSSAFGQRTRTKPIADAAQIQSSLASAAAVKLSIRQEGWYRVTQQELIAAGLQESVDPRYLQLFVDGVEQPLLVSGENDGRLDPADAIEFYGQGLDTPSTNTRVYWLAIGKQPGKRVKKTISHGKPGGAPGFAYTVERKERSIYFSGLLNGDAENFFGPIVASRQVDQSLSLRHLDNTAGTAKVEVALQGVTDLAASPDHRVSVALNGSIIGHMLFDGREHRIEQFLVYATQLVAGTNTVTLTGQGGNDVTLVDYVRITYNHAYTADNDSLMLTASGASGLSQTIQGFSTPLIRVIDVTNPETVEELVGQIEARSDGGFAVTVDVPGREARALIALTDAQVKRPASITHDFPSSWRSASNGADMLIITRRELSGALEPLCRVRQSQSLSVSLVDIEDVYDEFSFGQKTPQALKEFLSYAALNWKKKPRFVLLAGDASFDPRNYLGYGDNDLVPTRLIDTQFMETASDDWLGDLDNDGLAEVAVGRLPVRTAAEATKMVAKIVGYERGDGSEELLLISDESSGYDFEGASTRLMPLVPVSLRVGRIDRGRLELETAKKRLIEAINRGQKIVNYTGHGSVDLWNGSLLTADEARALENVEHLPLFVMMTCLNGYFQDAAMDSLGEALMKGDGGAVAVWASTGMTMPMDQWTMNEELYRALFDGDGFNRQRLTIGEAARRAKSRISELDIRRTWVLLGDPSMKLR